MLVDFKSYCFSSAESRSTKQGTEHLLVPFRRREYPGDYVAGEVGRVLLALIHHWHVDKFVVPFARKELLAFLVDRRSHDGLDDLRVGVDRLGRKASLDHHFHQDLESGLSCQTFH